jgi:polysaccharide export outer membrane protein
MVNAVADYIATFPPDVQGILAQIRSIVRETAPNAEEGFAYQMPSYKLNGKPLVYFAAFSIHVGLYATPTGHEAFKEKLAGYIKDPIIIIRIQNFKVTILGDVRSPYTYTIPNERLTILEAIGLAGDLNPTAKRKNILLIREENNIKKHYRIDLTKDEILNSNLYYENFCQLNEFVEKFLISF